MTEESLPLAELLSKAGDGDFLRSVAEAVVQLLMESDVEGLIGACRHERTGEWTTYRNGYRDRTLDTRLGSLQLRIPKLRRCSYFSPFLEPRKTTEKAPLAVIQEAWVSGVSTRRVDDLVQAMVLSGISKSTVSKLCKEIDERVGAFLDRPLAGEWPYLWLDDDELQARILPPPKLLRPEAPARIESSRSLVRVNDWAGAVVPTSHPTSEDPANAGIRREPELPEHEDIAPELAKPLQEFELADEESDDDAQRVRALQRNARAVARQVTLDPADDMGL